MKRLTGLPAGANLTDMSVTKTPTKTATVDPEPAKDKRRAELLAAAADVFTAKGFHEAKVSDIVAAAGVAQGTFYLYFKTKADVLQQLVGGCCRDIVARLATGSAAKTGVKTPKELREHNIEFLVDIFTSLETEDQAAKLILGATVGVDPAVDESLRDFRAALVKIVKKDLDQGIARGYIRRLNREIVAEAIVGMIYHIAFERFVLNRRLGKDIRHLAEEIVDFELGGIAAGGRGHDTNSAAAKN